MARVKYLSLEEARKDGRLVGRMAEQGGIDEMTSKRN